MQVSLNETNHTPTTSSHLWTLRPYSPQIIISRAFSTKRCRGHPPSTRPASTKAPTMSPSTTAPRRLQCTHVKKATMWSWRQSRLSKNKPSVTLRSRRHAASLFQLNHASPTLLSSRRGVGLHLAIFASRTLTLLLWWTSIVKYSRLGALWQSTSEKHYWPELVRHRLPQCTAICTHSKKSQARRKRETGNLTRPSCHS